MLRQLIMRGLAQITRDVPFSLPCFVLQLVVNLIGLKCIGLLNSKNFLITFLLRREANDPSFLLYILL